MQRARKTNSRLAFTLRRSRTLAQLSQARLQGDQLTVAQVDFLNSIDLKFYALSGVRDRPIVTDVHTDPNSSQVVQFAVGSPELVIRKGLRGARMSFHQFKQPLHQRMTDQQWYDLSVNQSFD